MCLGRRVLYVAPALCPLESSLSLLNASKPFCLFKGAREWAWTWERWAFLHVRCVHPRVLTVNLSMTPSHLAFSSLEARTHLAGHLKFGTWEEGVLPAEVERGKVTENKLCKFAGFGELLCVFCYTDKPVFPERAGGWLPFQLINIWESHVAKLRMANIYQHECVNRQ